MEEGIFLFAFHVLMHSWFWDEGGNDLCAIHHSLVRQNISLQQLARVF